MNTTVRQAKMILLAEDDDDDIFLFKNALAELEIDVNMKVAQNGQQCMELLMMPVLPITFFLISTCR
jgi:hypothetical protein